MDNTWIKLYRKINLNSIIKDKVALQLFIWTLTNVDKKTGEIEFGRFIIARQLKINPNTLYSALKRLVQKYKVCEIISTKPYTKIRLLHWDKYQPQDEVVNTSVNTPSTPTQHSINTYTRIENKNKEKESKEKETEDKKTSKNSQTPCTQEELWEIANSLSVSIKDVKLTHDSILDQIESKEFKHKTVFHSCRNWIRMAIQRGTIRVLQKTIQAVVNPNIQISEQTPEDKEKAERVKQMIREKLHPNIKHI